MANPAGITCMSLTSETRVFHFKVDNYSLARRIADAGECFQSETFALGGYDWAVRYYPCYLHEGRGGWFYGSWISLVLLNKPSDGVKVRLECMLVDDSGKPSTESFSFGSLFGFYGQEEGCKGSLDQETLDDISETRDCFVVQCTISLLKKPFKP